jgi:hypothetical protein
MTTRTASHVVVTTSGTVHLAADAKIAPYHVLACNGRAVQGMAWSNGDLASEVTCNVCRKGVAAGRIEVEGNALVPEPVASVTYVVPNRYSQEGQDVFDLAADGSVYLHSPRYNPDRVELVKVAEANAVSYRAAVAKGDATPTV